MQRNKHRNVMNRWFVTLFFWLMLTTAQAATPLWTIVPAPGSHPTQTVLTDQIVTVQYIVQNQSKKPKRLALLPIPGIYQTAPCPLAPKGQPGSSCTVTLTISGQNLPKGGVHGGPALCQTNPDGSPNPNQCYQPAAANILHLSLPDMSSPTLSISLNTLALATQGILTDASGAGDQVSKARRMIITNTGTLTALNVNFTVIPALPLGTTISPASCGTIPANGTCELTITPGNTPSGAADTIPTPSVLTIQGSNTPTAVSANIVVLTYGNRYQGGFVFAIDDSTADTMSVGGKVAALNDQSSGINWSPVNDEIPGIDETSTEASPSPALPPPPTDFVGCNGATDGMCNVGNIFIEYAPADTFAAGLCSATINGFNNWYLPAICETGYGGFCGSVVIPNLQNMQSNLVNDGIGGLAGNYWSSTEFSGLPTNGAWYRVTGGGQFVAGKAGSNSVRCVRIFE